MVANRDSIAKVGGRLAELVISGGADTKEAIDLAVKLERLCRDVGTYTKRYETHEERVLHRHLNLYINKRDKARTEPERLRWQAKVIEQQAKIDAISSPEGDDLDLDGL